MTDTTETIVTPDPHAIARAVLLEVAELMGISTDQCIAVGDGANDLPMMMAAGLSIAYHPKPAVREKALVSITQGGLDRALQILR